VCSKFHVSQRVSWPVGCIAAMLCSVSVAGVIDSAQPQKNPAHEPRAPAASAAAPVNRAAAAPEHKGASTAPRARGEIFTEAITSPRAMAPAKVKCAGCGVIESVRKVEIDESLGGRCVVGETESAHLAGHLLKGAQKDVVTLADAVAGATGANAAKKTKRTSSYQIIVRFRDGTRHVFTEATPRSLRQGDRVLVVGPNRFDG
jgi:outer membrane lipoprotein SlyB